MIVIHNNKIVNIEHKPNITLRDVLNALSVPLDVPIKFELEIDDNKALVMKDWGIDRCLSQNAKAIINWEG